MATALDDALFLDLQILQLLLQRNRKQHFHTQYYRRLDMVLLSIRRFCRSVIFQTPTRVRTTTTIQTDLPTVTTIPLSKNIEITKKVITELYQLLDITHQDRALVHSSMQALGQRFQQKSPKEQRKQKQSSKLNEICSTPKNRGKEAMEQNPPAFLQTHWVPFVHRIYQLHDTITKHLPEIFSRILFAASSLYQEICRGFFVPFCSVTLACISRIRVLLMKLGREAFATLQATVGWLQEKQVVWDPLLNVTILSTQGTEKEEVLPLSMTEDCTTISKIVQDCNVQNHHMDPFMELEAQKFNKWMMNHPKKNRHSVLIRDPFAQTTHGTNPSNNKKKRNRSDHATKETNLIRRHENLALSNPIDTMDEDSVAVGKVELEDGKKSSHATYHGFRLTHESHTTDENDDLGECLVDFTAASVSASSQKITKTHSFIPDGNLEIVEYIKQKRRKIKHQEQILKKDIDAKYFPTTKTDSVYESLFTSIKSSAVSTNSRKDDIAKPSSDTIQKKKKSKTKDVIDEIFNC